jgi:hypothetical protein
MIGDWLVVGRKVYISINDQRPTINEINDW